MGLYYSLSSDGVEISPPVVEGSTPGVEKSSPGVEGRTPGVELSSPGVEGLFHGFEGLTPGVGSNPVGTCSILGQIIPVPGQGGQQRRQLLIKSLE